MRIENLRELKGAGVLADRSRNDDSLKFRKLNLIYGFNGSGKSTLSRIFAALEIGMKGTNLPEGASFQIEFDDGKVVESGKEIDAFEKHVVVFNNDYIDRNLRWAEGLVSPVFFIGSKQADASRELEKREAERGEWLKKKDQFGELHRTKEKSFGAFKRERAKLIASSLHLANRRYEAPALMQDFQTWRDESLRSLSADELRAAQETCRAETPMPELSPLTVNVERVGSAYNFVRGLCEQSISMIALEELQRHPDMLMWLKQGLEYHAANDLDECLFCGNRLTSDRRSTLDAALDEKVDKFIAQLTQSKARLAQLIMDLEVTRDALHRRAEFVGELQAQASTSRTKYEEALALLISMLRSLERTLDRKIALPAQPSETSALEAEQAVKAASEKLSMAVASYNHVVERHNAIRAEFAQHKSAAEVSVRKHFIADAIEEIRGHETEVADAQRDYEETVTKIAELDADIAAFQTQIREHGPAANVINALIEAYLGHGELKIHPIDEGYELLRHSRPIEGTPSEGEKTAIAISYFLSSIDSDGKNLKEMIVVVDDPVSSLDTKALNYACALIRSRLATASQVIILTHNLQCMNEFKKAWKNRARPRDGKDPTATFLYLDVKKEAIDGERQSHFMEMSRLLREYDSEYHFLFKHVIDFTLSEADYHDHSYMMPNVLRRVLDVFLAFKCPGSSGLTGQLDQLCSDHKDLDRDRLTGLERLAQVESHSDNLDDLLSFSSMTIEETKGAASLLLEMIETVDPNHLRSVKRLCRD
ncbi:MAG: metallophosphoesterase [Salinicola sp.]|nr:metallophosphoesterase [Salinicola sp.]HCS16778.1 metallophosphoesterase [Erythrobacter sp.]